MLRKSYSQRKANLNLGKQVSNTQDSQSSEIGLSDVSASESGGSQKTNV